MLLRLPCLALTVLLLACPAQAQDGASTPGSIKGDPRFNDVRSELARLVRRDGPAGVNRLCVVAYRRPGRNVAYVYWPDRMQVADWEGGDILAQWRPLHILRDVVPDLEAVGGSTYLVTRAWVEGVVGDCYRHGDWYRIRR